jgi:HEAT repeat protein
MLCALLKDNRSKLRAEAARSLGMIDAPGGPSESLLRQCLEGSDDDTQRQSAIALALLGRENPDVLRLLSISLARRDFDALPALHSLPNGTQYFGPTLVKMLHDSTIRRYGVLAIGHLSNVPAETFRIVSEHLTDETLEVRMAAADALGRLGPMARSELAALQRALADDDWLVQEAAQRAIEKIR